MQKKYCLLMLAFALMLGTTAASISPVKAQDTVRFYVWTELTTPPSNIVPGQPTLAFVTVEVWVDSPVSWDNTTDGIAAYALSIRVDPRALQVYEPYPADKIRPAGQPPSTYPPGFLEEFLLEYGYSSWSPMPPPGSWTGYKTAFRFGEVSAALGYTLDVYEGIVGFETLGVGAGGTSKLCQFFFVSDSDTLASPLDICGRPQGTPLVVVEKASYWTPDGTEHTVDVMDDGYYRAETPDITFFDLTAWGTSVIGSHWHELSPEPCREWRIDSHEDTDADGELDPSEQIDMTRLIDEYKAWYHVEWVNPDPVPGDGKADLIVKFKKEVPEFPLGVVLMMAIAPAIPIVYLWRTRKKEE